jgi:subtilisin family serine protease
MAMRTVKLGTAAAVMAAGALFLWSKQGTDAPTTVAMPAARGVAEVDPSDMRAPLVSPKIARGSLVAGNPWDEQERPGTQTSHSNSMATQSSAAGFDAPADVRAARDVSPPAGFERMSPRIAELARRNTREPVQVLVRFAQMPREAERQQIESLGGTLTRTYANFPLAAISAPANRLLQIANAIGVSFIDEDAIVHSAANGSFFSSSGQTSRVPGRSSGTGSAQPVSTTLGVAIVDSGVATHPDVNVASRVTLADARNSLWSTYRDDFTDVRYDGSTGTDPWYEFAWIERGDDNNPGSGAITVEQDWCPDALSTCAELDASAPLNTALEREVNLLGATRATLVFDYRLDDLRNAGDTVAWALDVSTDGGATWRTTPLVTFSSVAVKLDERIDLTPFAARNTRFRFRLTNQDANANLWIDNVRIEYKTTTWAREEFNSVAYNNTNGNEAWASNWTEIGDDGSASKTSGNITVEVDNCPDVASRCVEIDARGGVGDAIQRQINLSNAFSAVLTFDWRVDEVYVAAEYVLEVSSNGGSSWTVLDRFSQNNDMRVGAQYDLTPYRATNTMIRFRVTKADDGSNFYFDNVQIDIDRGNADDRYGHGTHIAGIVGGTGNRSGSVYLGMAPNVRIHQVRVLDGRGRGSSSDLLAGLDWILSNGVVRGIKIVNLSLGTAVRESNTTDPLVLAVERLWDAGFVVVASAGNLGQFGNMTITSPGNSRKIITVGSLTDNGSGTNFADDYVSTYSSMGPTLYDHVLKPDLVAPGNRVVSALAPSSRMQSGMPERVPGTANCGSNCANQYLELSGSSMAAAVVSGTAALMLSKDATLNPATIKARLMRSARKLNIEASHAGAGVVDAAAALADTGRLTGQALSPLMARSSEGSVILVEDTARLWGDATWGAGYLWNNGYLWSNRYTSADGYLWSDGYLWNNGYLWSNGYLWNNGYLWQNGYLWSDGYLWQNSVGGNTSASTLSLLGD